MDRYWIAIAALAILSIGAGVVMGTATGSGESIQDESTTAELVDQAENRTEEVSQIQRAASRVIVQLVSGAGLGIGLGAVIGAFGMYAYQRSRLQEEFS